MCLFTYFGLGRHGFTDLKPHWADFKLVSPKCWDYRNKSSCTTIIYDLMCLSNAEIQNIKIEKR